MSIKSILHWAEEVSIILLCGSVIGFGLYYEWLIPWFYGLMGWR